MPIRRSVPKEPQEEPQEEEPSFEVEVDQDLVTKYKAKIHNPVSAIRAHCVECMGGAIKEITVCTNKTCSLYKFRMGRNTMHSRSIAARKKR